MKKTRILAAFCAAVMLCAAVPILPELSISARAEMSEEFEYEVNMFGDFSYEVNEDETVTIKEYTGRDAEVVIPAEIDGKAVKSIGDWSFQAHFNLTSVIIPAGVTNIGKYAFGSCTALTSVTIPESVTKIDEDAFGETAWIEEQRKQSPFVIVNHILIDGKACEGEAVIPEGVTSISQSAFECCESLTSVTIPEGVTNIGHYAFHLCTSLASVTIPESVTSIGESVFLETPWLEELRQKDPLVIVNHIVIDAGTCEGEITIPDGVNSISGRAFEECTNLTAVTFPDSLTSIGDWAFLVCTGLTAIEIPESVSSIGFGAFCGCTGLTSVTIPEGVKRIDDRAFADCTKLTAVTIPENVTNIGEWAFIGSDNLTIYGYEGSYAESYAAENNIPFKPISEAPVSESLTAGDVDGSGEIDIMDVILLNKYLLSAAELTEAQKDAADVDNSGTADSIDALNILKYVAKIITAF